MENSFINYGEIKKEEEKQQDLSTAAELNLSPAEVSVDVDKMKETSIDIKPPKKEGTADLDNLLNLGNPTAPMQAQFITTAEKIVKTDGEEEETKSDYFQITDLSNPAMQINMPGQESGIYMSETTSPLSYMNPGTEGLIEKGQYTLEDAEQKIKDLVTDLTKHGIKITSNEMDFEKSYQVILKIEK